MIYTLQIGLAEVYAPLSFNTWRIRYGAGIAAFLVLYGVFEWAVQ